MDDMFGNFGQDNLVNYERRIVKDLATRMKVERCPPNADFQWLAEETRFPLTLRCGRYPHIHALTMSDLVGKRFLKLPFVAMLEEMREFGTGERYAGVVFPWPHLDIDGNEMMIIHEIESVNNPSRFVFRRKLVDKSILTIQTLRSLVEDLHLTPA